MCESVYEMLAAYQGQPVTAVDCHVNDGHGQVLQRRPGTSTAPSLNLETF